MMRVNEGTIDRLMRLVIAATIIAAFLAGNLAGYWALLLVFSGTLLMSGFTGYCPLYSPLGINTAKNSHKGG